ncbi:MAG: hypothetical protein IMX00_00165 [Limnochordales bacterium]|nr:hypothetical protein [Limnochordales bacterium]
MFVPEVEAVDGRGLRQILCCLAKLAIERRVGQVTFFIHPESDMALLLRFFGAEVTITYNFDRGSMARVINLASTLQKLSPVLQQCMTSALGSAADMLSEPSVRVTPGLAPVIEALFPAGMPYVPRVNRL